MKQDLKYWPYCHMILKIQILSSEYIFLQVIIMSVTIAPLRLLLVGLCLLLAWPLAAIAVAGRTEEDRKQPLVGWRK